MTMTEELELKLHALSFAAEGPDRLEDAKRIHAWLAEEKSKVTGGCNKPGQASAQPQAFWAAKL
jgi:hypothetical protein